MSSKRAQSTDRHGPELSTSGLLGPAEVRAIASTLGIRPTKVLGQNFVHDAGTVRRIVQAGGVQPGDEVLEVGPGLGSLTLALLEAGARVRAVEIDQALAQALPATVAGRMPEAANRLLVINQDALKLQPEDLNVTQSATPAPDPQNSADVLPSCLALLNADIPDLATTNTADEPAQGPLDLDDRTSQTQETQETQASAWPMPTRLVANLPYNVAVPVLLTLLERFDQITDVMVMVQAEVADRLAAGPGSRTYGVPSVKAAWYGLVQRAGTINRTVFWPVPNVDSALVRLTRGVSRGDQALRRATFEVVEVAFGQRRKTLRAALKTWAGSVQAVEALLAGAGVDPQTRGETLSVEDFVRLGAQVLAMRAAGQLPDNQRSRQAGVSND